MNSTNAESSNQEVVAEIDRFSEIEIQKVFDALLSTQNLRVQIGTFFGSASLTTLGIAFSVQKSGLVIIAALFFWISILMDFITRGTLLSYYYRALVLQKKFSPDKSESFLGIFLSPKTEENIHQIIAIPEQNKRLRALRRLPFHSPGTNGFWIPLTVSFIEIGLGIILWRIFGWNLF